MSLPIPEASPDPTSPPSPPLPLPPPENTTTPPSSVNTSAPLPATLPLPLPVSPPPAGNGSSLPPPSPPEQSNNTTLIALGVGIGIGGAIVLVFVGIFIWYKRRKRRLALEGSHPTHPQGPKDDPGGPRQHWQHIASSQSNDMVGLLPKPTPPLSIASNPQLSLMGFTHPQPPLSISSTLGSEKLLPQPSIGMGFDVSKTVFTYGELALATGDFSNANLLGQGGFGYVHKGVLPNGKKVAIKQLKVGSGQGEREFQSEVEIISRVHHKHLVSLVGYCTSGPQRMLVYEFVPNNTLEFHLHGKGHIPINWPTRMKVALGSAKGLAYLHDCQPKIIHHDIKAANILLDSNFEPKVADFGLARLFLDTDTHVSTRVMGTFGYLAPEYALTGKLTDKSDVFSFGVMLLELITGHQPIDKYQFLDYNIVDW